MRFLQKFAGVAAGVAFAGFPLLRPWGDKDGTVAGMAEGFADGRWVAAHLVGMAGWGLLAAWAVGGRSRLGAWLIGAGTMLVLPFYGAETFGLHALGVAGADVDAGQDAIRNGGPQLTLMGLGLVSLAAGAVAEFWADRRWSTGLLAAGVVAYLPQFFAAPPVRIGHGILLGLGCVAAALGSRTRG